MLDRSQPTYATKLVLTDKSINMVLTGSHPHAGTAVADEGRPLGSDFPSLLQSSPAGISSCRPAGCVQTLCNLGQAEQSHHTGKPAPCASNAVGVNGLVSCVKVKYYSRHTWQQVSVIFMLSSEPPFWVTK